jgi:hypothetical protein
MSLRGLGSSKIRRVGLFAGLKLPEKPLLDALLREEPVLDVFGKVIEPGMPQFRFEAE